METKVMIDGAEQVVTGNTMQEMFDNYVRMLDRQKDASIPMFEDYCKIYYKTYKKDQESLTIVNRDRVLRNHVHPVFGKTRIDRIRTIDLQQYFNEVGKKYAKETAMKIKNVMSPVFDSAVEDGYITRNPFKSKRLVITGKDPEPHKAIPKEKFAAVKEGLAELPWKHRIMGGLLCYTGMRFEEVLGVKWEDLDGDWITVQRAVVHPTRSYAEIKNPKTRTSKRRIPVHPELKKLTDSYEGEQAGFMLAADENGEKPLSYTQARNMLRGIRKKFGIQKYSAHDFRDTCATVWRENGIPLDVIARLLGHSKTDVTEKRYVKYREELILGAIEKM